MAVRVRLAFPYRKLVGREVVELEVNSSTRVRDLLSMISERYPGFKEYSDKGTDEQMATHMVILLQDQVLRLDDPVESDATIQIMAPIAGG
jgi:molybdopterin converting factor small subunit